MTATETNVLPARARDGTATIIEEDRQHVMQTYKRMPVVFARGEGAWLWDTDERRYLDLLGGIAVALVGHSHPHVAGQIARQAGRLMHVSNLFYNELQAPLAGRLCQLTGMDRVFFCNSGAEAVETAIKIARKRFRKSHDSSPEIVTFEGGFHGRTFGALAATARPQYQASFQPMLPGFRYARLNDEQSVRDAISPDTCAIFVEAVQGEGGIRLADDGFLRALRALCDRNGLLLVADEVQCGMGRTGRFLGVQHSGCLPDVVTLAKGIASGVPMGVCLARGEAAEVLQPGDQGSTFGGQPLACAAAMATLDVLEREDLIMSAAATGHYLQEQLRDLRQQAPGQIEEVRGRGLMVALELTEHRAPAVVEELLRRGVVANATSPSTIRLLPPLVVTREQCDHGVSILRQALQGQAP